MEAVYIYDGGYLTLLNLIAELLKNNIRPVKIKESSYSPSLFENVIELDIPSDKQILTKIQKSFGGYAANLMYYVFLSEEDNKEMILYYFFLNALKYQKNITLRRNLKCVNEVFRIFQYVTHEAHKLKGFLRFRELENKVLYAEMEPTNNVILILSNHFKKRLPNEYWIIRDVKRGILSIYDKKEVIVLDENTLIIDANFSEEEKDFEDLWKVFYKTIGIKERKNDRCRRNFMPKKYWKYILEVQEEL